MRKITILIMLTMLLALNAHAGLITYTTLSSDNGLSYDHLNTSFTTIYDEFNGAVEGGVNIEADSLVEADFADEINPRIRTSETIGDYTDSGHLPAISVNLTSNISAGTSYVVGYRIVTAATSKTYTASKDTWVYIDKNGAFQYEEVATGAVQPTTPTDSLLLAQVVCDGDNITSVVDKRQTTPPAMRIYQDIKLGAVISRDITTATTVNIKRGTIDFGSGVDLRRNTLTSDIVFTTTGRGGLDNGSLAEGYYALWAVPDDDNSTNFEGVASTSFSATSLSITGERLIGWCYAPDGNAISPDSIGAYRGLGGDAPNIVKRQSSETLTLTNTTVTEISAAKFYSSGRPVKITFYHSASSSGADDLITSVLSIDNIAFLNSESAMRVQNSTTAPTGTMVCSWVGNLGVGTHNISAKTRISNNTLYSWNRNLIVEEL